MGIKQIERRIERHATSGYIGLGDVNKGAARTPEQIAKKQPGTPLPYFRVTFREGFEYLKPAFDRIYGAEPTHFDPVLILGDTPEKAFESWREGRDKNGDRVNRHCDGEFQQMWYDEREIRHDTANEAIDPLPCPPMTKDKKCPLGCGYAGRLYLIFPDFYWATKKYGYFTLRTGSQSDIAHVLASLNHWYPIAQLETLAFSLKLEKKHNGWRPYEKNGEVKSSEMIHYLLTLEPAKQSAEKIAAYLAAQTSAMPSLMPGNVPNTDEDALFDPSGRNDASMPLLGGQAHSEVDDEEDAADGDFTEDFIAHSVYVDFVDGQYMYLLRCEGARNFWLYDTSRFEALGLDVSKWQAKAKVIKFNPPLIVTARDEDVIGVRRGE